MTIALSATDLHQREKLHLEEITSRPKRKETAINQTTTLKASCTTGEDWC